MADKNKIHILKCWPEYFAWILPGLKRFEIRKIDKEEFNAGDYLILQEYDPEKEEMTGNSVVVRVLLVYEGFYQFPGGFDLPEGFVIMSIELINPHKDKDFEKNFKEQFTKKIIGK